MGSEITGEACHGVHEWRIQKEDNLRCWVDPSPIRSSMSSASLHFRSLLLFFLFCFLRCNLVWFGLAVGILFGFGPFFFFTAINQTASFISFMYLLSSRNTIKNSISVFLIKFIILNKKIIKILYKK